jgi:voltage-gated potassium channel
MASSKRLLFAVVAFLGIIAVGTTGYVIIEGWDIFDAVYMTVITITTVGYQEVHALSTYGRIFTIFLVIGGVGGALYTLTAIVEFVLEGNIGTTLGRRQMNNRIAGLRDHFIICGYGRVGQEIARILAEQEVPFVVVDKDKEAISRADQDGRLYVQADAANENALTQAGIEHAKGLIVALGNDADSTYVTLSAHQLKKDLFIEARASTAEAESKLKHAGATRVVSPYSTGARRMAMLALRPEVADFIDVVSHRDHDLGIEIISLVEGTSYIGRKVSDLHNETGITVLAITREGGKLVANPDAREVMDKGDHLIVLGTNAQLKTLGQTCGRCQVG